MIINKKQLTEIFNVTSRTVEDWESKGMPVISRPGRGKSNEYDSAACIDWRVRYLAYGGKYTSAKERKEEAEASLMELKLEKESANILDSDEVEQAISLMLTVFKKRFEDMPMSLKEALKKKYGIDVDLKILKEYVRDLLIELSENAPQFEEIVDATELTELT